MGNLIERQDIADLAKIGNVKFPALAGFLMNVLSIDKVNSFYKRNEHLDAISFIDKLFEEVGVKFEFNEKELKNLPKEGAFLTISNHPFGGIEGLMLLKILLTQRSDSKLMTNFNGDRRLFREVLLSNGQSPLEYKDQLKEDIVHMHMLAQRKRTSDEISPQSVEDYYNQNSTEFRTEKRVKLSEIVIKKGEDNTPGSAAKLADRIHQSIMQGGDFNEIASKHGESPFRDKSGDWGVFASIHEIRNSKIKEVSFSLKKDEVSKPFEVRLLEKKSDGSITDSGETAWYIIKVTDIEEPRKLPINEVRAQIEKTIATNLDQNEQRKWLARQKRDAYVDIRLPSK